METGTSLYVVQDGRNSTEQLILRETSGPTMSFHGYMAVFMADHQCACC